MSTDGQVLQCLAVSDAVLAWIGRLAKTQLKKGNWEQVAQLAVTAGDLTARYGSSILADQSLEDSLRCCSTSASRVVRAGASELKWLHVFTLSYKSGGHTALARRWIEMDQSDDTHDLVLLEQTIEEASPALVASVQKRGGTVTAFLPSEAALVARSRSLQQLAQQYDAVVLHVHPWDPTPLIAFGSATGPPVLLVNHADHVFWFGASTADFVLNIRSSGEALCTSCRSVNRSLRLPIPLTSRDKGNEPSASLESRSRLGIPPHVPVFLTIGSDFKYRPMRGLNFMEMAAELLERMPDAVLLAVGPGRNDAAWDFLRSKFGARAQTMGEQRDLRPFHDVASVYLEGFPFGSLTALLEAVQVGIPPVLAPPLCPLPYRSDDPALEEWTEPADIAAYLAQAVELADYPASSLAKGAALGQRVRDVHCPPGWLDALAHVRSIVQSSPEHGVYPLGTNVPLDRARAEFWATYAQSKVYDRDPFVWSLKTLLEKGLQPKVDLELIASLRIARRSKVIAPFIHKAIFGTVVAHLPSEMGRRFFHRLTRLVRWVRRVAT